MKREKILKIHCYVLSGRLGDLEEDIEGGFIYSEAHTRSRKTGKCRVMESGQ